jgi:hypothetical protein
MRTLRVIYLSALSVMTLQVFANHAHAQTCATTRSCIQVSNPTSNGFAVTNSTTTGPHEAIFGQDDTGIGVEGTGNVGVSGNGVGPLTNYGVEGVTSSGWPSAGVFGNSIAQVGGSTGVKGEATHGGFGVWGDTDTGVGVVALSTADGNTSLTPVGLQAVANGDYGQAIQAICNGTCESRGNGWAGTFAGPVEMTRASLYVNGKCIAGTCLSDVRLKKDVQPLIGALEKLSQLRPVTSNGETRKSAAAAWVCNEASSRKKLRRSFRNGSV